MYGWIYYCDNWPQKRRRYQHDYWRGWDSRKNSERCPHHLCKYKHDNKIKVTQEAYTLFNQLVGEKTMSLDLIGRTAQNTKVLSKYSYSFGCTPPAEWVYLVQALQPTLRKNWRRLRGIYLFPQCQQRCPSQAAWIFQVGLGKDEFGDCPHIQHAAFFLRHLCETTFYVCFFHQQSTVCG